jgi:ABC-type transporter Mla subunit MlaD
MAEMLTDMLNSIYGRIAQLGQSIQGLKESLDGLNKNIEEKIKNLSNQFRDLKGQIDEHGNVHVNALLNIGETVTKEITKLQDNLAINAIEKLIGDLDSFSKIAEQTLKQENVDIMLKEALDSINLFKEQKMSAVEEEEVEEGGGEE